MKQYKVDISSPIFSGHQRVTADFGSLLRLDFAIPLRMKLLGMRSSYDTRDLLGGRQNALQPFVGDDIARHDDERDLIRLSGVSTKHTQDGSSD